MPTLVGVSFQPAGKVVYYDAAELALSPGEAVVVETPRGTELGKVVGARDMPAEAAGVPPRRILRKAGQADLSLAFRQRLRAVEARRVAREAIRRHNLPMKLIDCEYTLDGNKVVFYFSAERRVDFRELVRDLASRLRKRIELHQVGARDRSSLTGGLGPCGRECCCSSWIREFTPVSIKMAKEQGLSLNPSKISGSCGRLMCCLRYEYQAYRELRRELPSVGSELRLPEGTARVLAVHPASHTLTVEHPELGVFDVPAGRALHLAEQGCASCSAPRAACPPAQAPPRPPALEGRQDGRPGQPGGPAPGGPAASGERRDRRRRRRGGSGRGQEPAPPGENRQPSAAPAGRPTRPGKEGGHP
jgi:cell fate regulator YaaT (PSP1 superfamily)